MFNPRLFLSYFTLRRIKNLQDSNEYIIKLLSNNRPFIISRLGIGAETLLTYYYLKKNVIKDKYIFTLSNNAGIYNIDKNNIMLFIKYYSAAIKNSVALACFENSIRKEQNFFVAKYNIDSIRSRVVEPFYCCNENIKPWSHLLLGKKVLIVNSFTESMKKQISNNFQIFKDPNKKIFLDDQKLTFYKSFQTSAGNHIHDNWLETYTIMCKDIKKLDFDIALLGCGGYGLPLCNYIYETLNKSAIYIGGGLQLLFGVMGKRWENIPMWEKIIKENNTKFIKPSGDEVCNNNDRVEDGCYW